MLSIYVMKIECSLQRALSASEKAIAADKMAAGWAWTAVAEYLS